DDVAPMGSGCSLHRGDHYRGDAGLHVERSPPEQSVTLDTRIERIAVIPGQRDRIEMAVQHQRLSVTASPRNGHHRWTSRPGFQPVDLKAAFLEPGRGSVRDCRLPGSSRNEIRVRRLDADQLLEKLP